MFFALQALLGLFTAQVALGHTTFTNFFLNGIPQGDGTCVRMSHNPGSATDPVYDVTSSQMACGLDGQDGVAFACPVKVSDLVTVEFRHSPALETQDAIDDSHKGPCSVYLKKSDDPTKDQGAGNGWFKIFEDGYDEASMTWCTERLNTNGRRLSIKLPSDLEDGYYLLRTELIALHNADQTPPAPQFYIGCLQLFVTGGSGTASPPTVSIPGYISSVSEPGTSFNIYAHPMALPYPFPGPPVYNSTSSSSSTGNPLTSRDTPTQTIGSIPNPCILKMANWCATEVPSYTDRNGCWRAQNNCEQQAQTCNAAKGGLPSTICDIWQTKCTTISNDCTDGTVPGPPNAGADLNPPEAAVSVPPAGALSAGGVASPGGGGSSGGLGSQQRPPVSSATSGSGIQDLGGGAYNGNNRVNFVEQTPSGSAGGTDAPAPSSSNPLLTTTTVIDWVIETELVTVTDHVWLMERGVKARATGMARRDV